MDPDGALARSRSIIPSSINRCNRNNNYNGKSLERCKYTDSRLCNVATLSSASTINYSIIEENDDEESSDSSYEDDCGDASNEKNENENENKQQKQESFTCLEQVLTCCSEMVMCCLFWMATTSTQQYRQQT